MTLAREPQDALDDCLIAITDGQPVPAASLAKLPRGRAVLIARVARRAGVPLEHGDLETLTRAANRCPAAALGEWWKP